MLAPHSVQGADSFGVYLIRTLARLASSAHVEPQNFRWPARVANSEAH